MKVLEFIFWKIVYHYWFIYKMAFIYYFAFSSEFRHLVRIERGCRKVERQDAWRVIHNRIMKSFDELTNAMNLIIVMVEQAKQL